MKDIQTQFKERASLYTDNAFLGDPLSTSQFWYTVDSQEHFGSVDTNFGATQIKQHLQAVLGKYLYNIEALERNLHALEGRFDQLESAKTTLIKNLPLKKIKLKDFISIMLEKRDSQFVISSVDMDLFGVGDTEYDAINDFSESLEELYFLLKEEVNTLGPHPKFIYNYLTEVITEI